jgi:hypothetical protein
MRSSLIRIGLSALILGAVLSSPRSSAGEETAPQQSRVKRNLTYADWLYRVSTDAVWSWRRPGRPIRADDALAYRGLTAAQLVVFCSGVGLWPGLRPSIRPIGGKP